MISALNANKNGKRAAMVHLYFNVISVALCLVGFYVVSAFDFGKVFLAGSVNAWTIAIIHTVFKLVAVALIFPFYKQLANLATKTVKDKKDENEATSLLDERLFETPSFAVGRASEVTNAMALLSVDALKSALLAFDNYDPRLADEVRDLEEKVDSYEDSLGAYLVKLSACDMSMEDSEQITKLLHIIGDFERISDHAVNIIESAEEMKDKKISFSDEAQRELAVIKAALLEIVDMTYQSLINSDTRLAQDVEALEEVIDNLREKIKLNHVLRLQKSECSIEHGFVLSDVLNDFERVSDHCSNIAGCVIEITVYDTMEMHKYLDKVKHGSVSFDEKFSEYSAKYSI
jgi:phosphate:Na+ symporter